VAKLVKDAMRRECLSMKHVVNAALRRALGAPDSRSEPYRVQEHESTVRQGIDFSGFNRLADEMNDERAQR
jgi:Arc/MetJ family transcription regulator